MRSSDRVEVAIPIQIIAEDLTTGTTFFRDCETSVVSRHGATVTLKSILSIDQEVALRCLTTNREVKARVVGVILNKSKEPTYGLAFLESDDNLWGIEFPELGVTDDGLVRLLMACEGCGRKEVVHLNEIEVEVFASNHALQRACPSCHEIRHWKQNAEGPTPPSVEIQTKKESPSKDEASPKNEPSTASSSKAAPANRRKERRVRTALSACIRRAAFNEEMVTCEDVSRGGIRFRTQKEYHLGGKIEVAVPCTPRAANIYVLARVAHIRRVEELFVVGVAFLSDSSIRPTAGNSVV